MLDATERVAISFISACFLLLFFFFLSLWDSNFNDYGCVLDNLVFILHILSSVVLCYFSG
jgi:hypothetical protein